MLTAGNETWPLDHFGNAKTKVVSCNTTTFGWDFESHLTSIDYPGTSNDDSREYDGHSPRMRSKLAGATNWTNFVWDELTHELLAEYTLIAGTYTIKALNTNGLGLISSNREGVKRYFHFDALGSTAALDDENENLKDSYTYEAYGFVTSHIVSNGALNPFAFKGRFGAYDDAMIVEGSRFLYSALRMYSASSGRFLTVDERSALASSFGAHSRHPITLSQLTLPKPGQSAPPLGPSSWEWVCYLAQRMVSTNPWTSMRPKDPDCQRIPGPLGIGSTVCCLDLDRDGTKHLCVVTFEVWTCVFGSGGYPGATSNFHVPIDARPYYRNGRLTECGLIHNPFPED